MKKMVKRLEDNDIRDMDGNSYETLAIDDVLIQKVNEIIDYLNKK